MTPRRVLVVGGTGVLREAATSLASDFEVTVVSRGPGSAPPGGRRLVVDASLASTTIQGGWDAAVLYEPAMHPEVVRRIARSTRGPVVLVVPSAALADHGGAIRRLLAATGAIPVLLGWAGARDAPRWHSPAEIGAAALAALHSRHDVRLGRFDGPRPV